MNRYIVEYEFKTEFTDERHNEEAARLDPCLSQYGVTWQASYLAADRTRMVCEFECESAEKIRDALRSADVQFARVWQAIKYQKK